MTNKELAKIKKELYNRGKDNSTKIRDYDEKMRMCRVNQKDYQIGNSLPLASIFYFLPIFILMFLDGNIDLSIITNVIPAFTVPILLIGGSLSIGTIISKLLNKKYKTKERFKSFSNAKTEVEKLEEEIKNQIELEKLNNRNKIINYVIEDLEDNVSILSKISDRYTITHRNLSQTKEETTDNITKISSLLEEKYKELDVLITKKVLHENFWRIREKFQRIADPLLITLGGSIGIMMLATLPFITAETLLSSCSILEKDIMFISSLVCGGIAPNIYLIKRNKDKKNVFNNINKTLGDNSLPEKIKSAHDEERELKSLIEKEIREISLAEIQLIEQKEVLERITSEDTNDKQKGNVHCSTLSNIIYEEEQKEIDNGINTLNNIAEQKTNKQKKLIRKPQTNK